MNVFVDRVKEEFDTFWDRRVISSYLTVSFALQQSVQEAAEPGRLSVRTESREPHLPVQPGLVWRQHGWRRTHVAGLVHELNLLVNVRKKKLKKNKKKPVKDN